MKASDVRILFVDDEKLIRDVFRRALRRWGYQADVAGDGEQALALCRERSYHILITDVKMPKMDGLQLLRRVKSRWPMTEVIVISGYATVESAIEAMKMGATDFILKPINFDYVKIVVKKCWQAIKIRQESTTLRRLNSQLCELNSLKDKFLSITNHEIRTPLTIIRGYLEILTGQSQKFDPETREILTIIRRTADELKDAVDRMHLLSSIHRATWLDARERIELTQLVRSIRAEMHRLFEHRSIRLKVQLPEVPVLVQGNRVALKLILRELLQNALKFTPDGGAVSVTVQERGEKALVEVRDTGIGIPYEQQELIFTDFYEAQDTIHHKSSREEFMGGGMGIGLSLVREMVERMKGRIMVDSEPGEGSTFLVFLPRASRKSPVAERTPIPAQPD
ncbi:MAG: hybrid sensor histidine kinase/response regulator, partial [Calditrichaeota bacterium]